MTRRKWASLFALSLVFLGTVWAFSSPRGSSADEDFHLVNIWCAWGDSEYCTVQPERGTAIVPEALVESWCYARTLGENSAGCLNNLSMQPFETGRISLDPLSYSIGFYKVMRALAGTDLNVSVQIMRLFNVLVAAGFLIWALLACNWSISRALALSWGVALVPVGIFFIASVNPSSWTIIGVGTFWAFLASLLSPSQRSRLRTWSLALGAMAAASLALVARTDSGIYLFVTGVAILIWRWKYVVNHLSRVTVILLAFLLGALGVFVYWLQMRRYGVFPFSFPGAQTSTDQPNPVLKMLLEVPSFFFAFFGGQAPKTTLSDTLFDTGLEGYRPTGFAYGVGWTETQFPSLVGLAIGAVVITMIIVGLRSHNRLRPISVVFVAIALLTQVVLMRAYFDFATIITIQPRYIYPLVLVLIGIALSLHSHIRMLNRTQALLLTMVLTTAGGVAWLAVSTRYALGSEATFTNFGQLPDWWWSAGPGRLASFVIAVFMTSLWFYVSVYLTATTNRLSVAKSKAPTSKVSST